MYANGSLTDVTLSATGTTLRAHRLVLASCSQYFAHLFKEMEGDNSNLVVVLGCEATELRLLLSFMYTGEVTASRKALPALLRLARALKVAGLTDADCMNPPSPNENEPKPDDSTDISSPITPITPITPINVDQSKDQSTFTYDEPKYQGNLDFKNDERLSRLDQIVQNLYSTHKIDSPLCSIPVTPVNTLEDNPPPYERKYRHGSVCTICKKRLSNQYNLRVHMETHAGGKHACRACAHVSRSRDALRKHVAYRHPDLAGRNNPNRDL